MSGNKVPGSWPAALKMADQIADVSGRALQEIQKLVGADPEDPCPRCGAPWPHRQGRCMHCWMNRAQKLENVLNNLLGNIMAESDYEKLHLDEAIRSAQELLKES